MPTTITEIEFYVLNAPVEERPHWVSLFRVPNANELLIRMKSSDGVEGFGLATSYTDISPITKIVKDGLGEEILGMDPLAPEQLYQSFFGLTANRRAAENGWGREALIRISSAVDLACWISLGRQPASRSTASSAGFNQVPCYVTCAYYRDGKDNEELRDEIQMLVEQGHRGFKGKVEGLSLTEDIERMEIVRDVIGPDRDLMIDVNRAWDLKTAIEGARLLEPLNPVWLEEPVQWHDDRRALKLFSQQTPIPLSGGESELTSYGCRAMLEEQSIQILQFDCTMFGGFTEGRKLAALCELNHVDVARTRLLYPCALGRLDTSRPNCRVLHRPRTRSTTGGTVQKPPHGGWLTLNGRCGHRSHAIGSCIAKFDKDRVVLAEHIVSGDIFKCSRSAPTRYG